MRPEELETREGARPRQRRDEKRPGYAIAQVRRAGRSEPAIEDREALAIVRRDVARIGHGVSELLHVERRTSSHRTGVWHGQRPDLYLLRHSARPSSLLRESLRRWRQACQKQYRCGRGNPPAVATIRLPSRHLINPPIPRVTLCIMIGVRKTFLCVWSIKPRNGRVAYHL